MKITKRAHFTEQTQGIVLKSVDFRDAEKIITVFTKEHGLISFIVKRISPSNLHKLAITTPFCQAEFFYLQGRSELLQFRDGTILCEHHELRQNFSHLQAAGTMAKALLQSQLPHKPAQELYALFDRFLKRLPRLTNPSALTSCFLLKLLRLEGLINLSHPPALFTSGEHEILHTLLESRSFKSLSAQVLSPTFVEKVHDYFTLCIGRQ